VIEWEGARSSQLLQKPEKGGQEERPLCVGASASNYRKRHSQKKEIQDLKAARQSSTCPRCVVVGDGVDAP